ncbi:MAG TPA: hypothetical protein VJZ91_06980 [Blastocatellia bacterium]|nr:hypothetical protein [Blastocatellia bacterium]
MSSNDQSTNDVITQPTLQTVLERINAVAGSITELRKDVDQRFNAVDGELANLRRDVDRGLRGVERKLGYLAGEFLEWRRVIEDLELRVEGLEKKAS